MKNKKDNYTYLRVLTKILMDIYKDDMPSVASLVYAEADNDYATIYKHLNTFKKELEIIEEKFKQEGNL